MIESLREIMLEIGFPMLLEMVDFFRRQTTQETGLAVFQVKSILCGVTQIVFRTQPMNHATSSPSVA